MSAKPLEHFDGSSGTPTVRFTDWDTVLSCSDQGDVTEAVTYASDHNLATVLVRPGALRHILSEYGAWDGPELEDHEENCHRMIWIAACDLRESPGEYS